jgi:hypothetical protein
MVAIDIQNFSESRTKARAYFCYLFYKNLPNRLPSTSLEIVTSRLQKIKSELTNCEAIYVLDYKGVQLTPSYTVRGNIEEDAGKIRTDRSYYYRAVKERRCVITDPYPSLVNDELIVTASQPLYNEAGELLYIACFDMPLSDVLRITHFNKMDTFFGRLFKYSYAVFAFALFGIAVLLFLKGLENFFFHDISPSHFMVKDMFNATILLTLSLAIFDLAKTLVEEEILGRLKEQNIGSPHKTMVRFLGSIIIALSIEALMLVFKFAMTDPDKLLFALYIIGGVALLVVSLAVYIRFTKVRIEQ